MKSFALVLALLPFAASAATITVNSGADNITVADGHCTLREAIANVNAAADTTGGDCTAGTGTGDTITFSVRVPGTIRRNWMLGPLTVVRDLTIMGPTHAPLRISGAGTSRVFEIQAGTTQMSGVTIASGRADYGGGILVDGGATLNMANCGIKKNRAALGGGIFNDGGSISLTACTLGGNKANNNAGDGRGGAMYNDGHATLTACTLKRNSARGAGANQAQHGQGYGGGIYNAGTLNVTAGIFGTNWSTGTHTNDFAGGGGGLYNDGTANLAASTFSGNIAKNSGGAINGDGTLNVTASTFAGNTAFTCGAVSGGLGTLTLFNSTLTGNAARSTGGAGGAVCSGDGTVTLISCTISRNHAKGLGGGILGGVTLINTILANNSAMGGGPNCENGGNIDGGHNLEDGDLCGFMGSGGCFEGSAGTSFCNTNPQLDPSGLKDNGGPTQTIALCTAPGIPAGCTGASPAIDAGDDSVTSPPDNLSTDQRGLPRLSGAHVDIGAYEVQ